MSISTIVSRLRRLRSSFAEGLRDNSQRRDGRDANLLLKSDIEGLEDRTLLASDFGDAPDTGTGASSGNYNTMATNNGPSHVIDVSQTTLFLGNSVDADSGTLQNATANADDSDAAVPDDEDGVLSPLDLQSAIGAMPQVTLLVTNTSGVEATLSGWIDFDQDGVFDNATERAQTSVPNSTIDGRFTLDFPLAPENAAGQTFARFRLSTDAAAQNATGAATDGEVEDHVFTITEATAGFVGSSVKIASGVNGGPTLANNAAFGSGVAALGDLDHDSVTDLAVSAFGVGTIYIQFMNANGTVKSVTPIASGVTGGSLANFLRKHWNSSKACGPQKS